MRKTFDWPTAAKNLNAAVSLRTEFSRNGLHNFLENQGLPCSSGYITSLVAEHHVVCNKGVYKFTRDHFNHVELERVMRVNRAKVNSSVSKIQQAIDLLKANGFVIFKQI